MIIDCDSFFGVHPASSNDVSVDRLISLGKSESVDYMLACSLAGRAFDAGHGNDAAMRVSKTCEEILPVATVDPRSRYGVVEEIERVAGLGFAALRVFPEVQGWALDSLLFAEIVDACTRCRLPLLVSAESGGKASRIVQMAEDTSLPIVLLGANYSAQAEALAAIAKRDNTYLCTRFFCTPGAYEKAVGELGAERFVFGSGSPEGGLRESLSTLLRSRLSDEEKQSILSGNIRRIISGQLAKLGKSLTSAGDLGEFEKKCVKTPIIDVHGHIGPWPFPMADCGGAEFVDLTRRRGIDKCVVSSANAIVNDFVEGNAELDKTLDELDGVYGYVTVNPNYFEQSVEQMHKYLDKPKFVGLKFHPAYTRASIDGEASMALAQVAACRNVPYLIHTMGPGEPGKIRKLAQTYPELPIIMGHGGGAAWREALPVVKETTNTYVEFCFSGAMSGMVREAINQIGAGRILFGTDLGLFDPAFNLGTYESADLTCEEEAAIMRDNARRLFRFDES